MTLQSTQICTYSTDKMKYPRIHNFWRFLWKQIHTQDAQSSSFTSSLPFRFIPSYLSPWGQRRHSLAFRGSHVTLPLTDTQRFSSTYDWSDELSRPFRDRKYARGRPYNKIEDETKKPRHRHRRCIIIAVVLACFVAVSSAVAAIVVLTTRTHKNQSSEEVAGIILFLSLLLFPVNKRFFKLFPF